MPEAPRVIGRREEWRGAGACAFSRIRKALAEDMAHMVQACAVVDLTMGAGTWATVALEQGLPYFGVAGKFLLGRVSWSLSRGI